MIRRLLRWLFGRPDPITLALPLEGPMQERPAILARREKEDRMIDEIDTQLQMARRHLDRAKRKELNP